MNAHKLLAVGVSAALLTAVTLFGSGCAVDTEDDPERYPDVAETDQEIVTPPSVDGNTDEGGVTIKIHPIAVDQVSGETGDREEESENGPTIPGGQHMEPEPDPWTPGKPNPDDPMEE